MGELPYDRVSSKVVISARMESLRRDWFDFDAAFEIYSETQWTDPHVRLNPASVHEPVCVDDVDHLISAALREEQVDDRMKSVLFGPLDRDQQIWVNAAHRDSDGSEADAPSPDRVDRWQDDPANDPSGLVKGFRGGLHTSTGSGDWRGLWREGYLREMTDTSRPRPWSVWRLRMSKLANVKEISNAKSWVELVDECARTERGFLVPDWTKVAEKYDAVHLTLRGVVATQGLIFETDSGLMPGGSWDVECTVWMNWQVEHFELVEIEV
ncbi:MAG: hypothetical protein INR66_26290 [Gordonia polyisoprenivorans]|nr:hypothetical protein [Gordonia polyisoprenivorans]